MNSPTKEEVRDTYEEAIKRMQRNCKDRHPYHGQKICAGCAAEAVIRERERDAELTALRDEKRVVESALNMAMGALLRIDIEGGEASAWSTKEALAMFVRMIAAEAIGAIQSNKEPKR